MNWPIEDRQWLISVMRLLRAGMALLGVLFAGLAWWDITGLHRWYLAPQMALMALIMAGTVIFATKVIRLQRAWLNERGDPLRGVLRRHYLTQITCDHEGKIDNPVCACSLVHLGWHPSVGAAVDAWINHVMTVLAGE
jgi:hypothetical protein